MFSAMLVWSVLGAPVPDFRDKLGTTFWDNWPRSAESALNIGLDKAGENQTERGIRTPGKVAPTQHFQCCTIGRSATSPTYP